MVRILEDIVAIDPALAQGGVVVEAIRLISNERLDHDGDYRFEFAAALRLEGKRWPKGSYVLQCYDGDGIMVDARTVEDHKTLDASVRQLKSALYAPSVAAAELIFVPVAGTSADEWERIEVRPDEDAAALLGVHPSRFRAEAHDDFKASNLTLIHVRGTVSTNGGLPFPMGLTAQLTVLDDNGDVLATAYADLSNGPASKRAIDIDLHVYRHQQIDTIEVDIYSV